MQATLLMAALQTTACSTWTPESFPVTVDMDSSLSEDAKENVVSATALLNDAVGAEVLKPVESNGRRIQRGRIHVYAGKAPHGAEGAAARNHWSCRVALDSSAEPIVVHELLHCFGLEHDPRKGSVMAEFVGRTLMPDHVHYLRDLAGIESSLSSSDERGWRIPSP